MNRLVLFATVASLALTGAALAQTGDSGTTPAATPKPAATATAPAKSPATVAAPQAGVTKPAPAPAKSAVAAPAQPAVAKTAMEKQKKPAAKPTKTARHEHARRHTAMHATAAAERIADRATKALNVLEAQGYGGNYANFQRDGKNYSALVMKDGKPEKVIVNPDTGAVTPQR